MTVQHKDIVDAQRHEPKGASTALNKTIYISNGAGSGTWTKAGQTSIQGLPGDSGNNNLSILTDGAGGFRQLTAYAHGSMTVSANATPIALTAAADPTLNTNSDYVLLTGTGAPWVSENLFQVTFNTNRLIAPVNGIYKIDLWSTIVGWPNAAAKVSVKHRVNGGTFSTRHPMARTPQAVTDPGELTGFGLLPMNANDYIQLYVASTNSGNLIFSDINMTLTLIRPT